MGPSAGGINHERYRDGYHGAAPGLGLNLNEIMTADVHPSPDGPTVAIVMPAYNAAEFLPRSLPAARAAMEAAGGGDVLVVDPGSTDDTAAIAEGLGARVLRLPERQGPAGARNAGCETIEADVAVFIDSDCVAHEDVVRRVRDAFAADPTMATLTGSYDDTPPELNFASLYMNLRHHHTHQQARTDDATFWAGCGAVRMDAFRAVNGFDAELYPRPMIEDIELGLRMRAHGATRLDPELRVTHLKRWTVKSVIQTDIVHRAIPWTKLIMERSDMPNDLNLRTSQRVAALVAPFALLALPGAIVAGIYDPLWAVGPAFLVVLSLILNAGLVGFFLKRRGLWFAFRGWLFHQVHLIYSAATFVIVGFRHRPRKAQS